MAEDTGRDCVSVQHTSFFNQLLFYYTAVQVEPRIISKILHKSFRIPFRPCLCECLFPSRTEGNTDGAQVVS
jgi:hypothetical protein